MIVLLVMTDGRRDCISRTIPSALVELQPCNVITELVVHDDSGDPQYRQFLEASLPGWRIIGPPAGRSGFGGAIRSAWADLREHSTAPFVFHLEDDFVFDRPVPLDDMVTILDDQPEIVQVALRRQAWNADEIAAGGVVELHPDAFDDAGGHLEHRQFFTTNPSVYRRDLIVEHDWPDGEHSEGRFTATLLADPTTRFAYYGTRHDPPWCEHIGATRVGIGY